MKLLIIGSKGFIGSHALQFFREEAGYDCWGCDVSVDYGSVNYFQIDASNADFSEIFELHQFDACINCSGAASVPDSLIHPLRDYYLNAVNVFKLLEAIRRHNPSCRFINLSSAAVYGNPASLPVKESDPVGPLSPYGYHKRQAEVTCDEFYNYFGIQTCCVRIFSAYGPGLKKQLLWDLYSKINNAATVVLFGTGNETRDFIYISDLINALHCVLTSAKYKGEIYNVANGEAVSIATVAELYSRHCGKQVSITFSGEERKGDPTAWQADISLLQGMGYQQKVQLEQGIINYIQWIKEQR